VYGGSKVSPWPPCTTMKYTCFDSLQRREWAGSPRSFFLVKCHLGALSRMCSVQCLPAAAASHASEAVAMGMLLHKVVYCASRQLPSFQHRHLAAAELEQNPRRTAL